MSKLIEHIAEYCKRLSGQELLIKIMDKQQLAKLPLAITGVYKCYEAVLMGVPIVLLEVSDTNYTPKQLQKHQMMVTRLIGKYAVFAMENVVSYHLSRMVDSVVNFIVPDKLIYVPSLLINLKEVKDHRKLEDELMPGVAQCILLFHLQRKSLNGRTTTELAEKFEVSYATMNRALRWLETKGIITMEGEKEKTLMMTEKGKALWEKAMPLMPSPVERIAYTDNPPNEMPDAGESALEKLTMIAEPEMPCKAVSKPWAQEHKDTLDKNHGECMVEVWRYNPMWLAEKNTIDRLSLYLSLRENDDERVRMELNNLMNKVVWLED